MTEIHSHELHSAARFQEFNKKKKILVWGGGGLFACFTRKEIPNSNLFIVLEAPYENLKENANTLSYTRHFCTAKTNPSSESQHFFLLLSEAI